jgi:type III secretion protein L
MAFVQFRRLGPESFAQADASALVLKADDVAVMQSAQQLLSQAREQAQQILASAQQAFEAERRRGFETGLEEARLEQTERMIDIASRTVDHFASIEQRTVSLVLESMRRIIDDFSDTERVLAVVKSGLAVLRNQRQLTLRLAPDHAEAVREQAAMLLERFPGIGLLDIVADPRLKGDAAILESDIGVVEASIESQLQAIEKGFARILGSRV